MATSPCRGCALLLVLLAVGSGLAAQQHTVDLTYYGEIGCSHCDTFVEVTVPQVEARHDVTIEVTTYDILQAEHYATCRDRLAELDRSFRVFPVLFIGNNAYQGNRAIDRGIEAELAYVREHGEWRPQVPPSMDGSQGSGPVGATRGTGVGELLPLVPVLLAGLADGINPCAFATVIFLLSLLALVGRSRRQILITGIVFAGTIFVTYFAIGFGLLSVLRELMNASGLRLWLRVIVSAGTAVLAILSFRDGLLIAGGRRSDAVLGLSRTARRRIHSIIRSRVRGGGLVVATVSLAFVVSILELACTGQLYLPTIAYLLQTGSPRAAEIVALSIYNIAFIVPLLIVVVIAYYGVSSQRIATWFSHRVVAAKMIMGCVFGVLAMVIWIV
jgi:hypothetical protein